MLDLVGIPQAKDRARSYPHEFSGGMRQRAMIAMAIINNPDIIIADEPTTALDVTVQAQILETLIEVKDAVNAAVILITHDLGVVAGMAHQVLVMYAGRGVERRDGRGHLPAPADALHRWAARLGPGAGQRRADAAPDHRGAAVADQPAARLPVLPTLPAGDASVCQTDEPELAPTDLPHHEVACHNWEQVAEVADPTLLFRTAGGGAVTQGPTEAARTAEHLLEVENLVKEFPIKGGGLDPSDGRRCAGGLRCQLPPRPGRDAGLGRGVRLREVDDRAGDPAAAQADVGLGSLQRPRADDSDADREMRPIRRDLQIVFQDPYASLNPQDAGQRHRRRADAGARVQGLGGHGPGGRPAEAGRAEPRARQPLSRTSSPVGSVSGSASPAHWPSTRRSSSSTSRSRRSTSRCRPAW